MHDFNDCFLRVSRYVVAQSVSFHLDFTGILLSSQAFDLHEDNFYYRSAVSAVLGSLAIAGIAVIEAFKQLQCRF